MRTPPTRAPQFIRTQVTMTASPNVGVGAAAAVGDAAYNLVSSASQAAVSLDHGDEGGYKRPEPVSVSLQRMKRDMDLLDDVTSRSRDEHRAVRAHGHGGGGGGPPFVLPVKLVEVLVPSMAALSAAIGLSVEYVGKTSVARGKQIAAVTLQAAAEEVRLAQAERAKAVVPLASASPPPRRPSRSRAALLGEPRQLGVQIITEVYLICPLLAAPGAAAASLPRPRRPRSPPPPSASAPAALPRRNGCLYRPTASARAPPPHTPGLRHRSVARGCRRRADRAHLRPRHPEAAVVLVGVSSRRRSPSSPGAAVLQGHRRCRRRRRPVRIPPSEGRVCARRRRRRRRRQVAPGGRLRHVRQPARRRHPAVHVGDGVAVRRGDGGGGRGAPATAQPRSTVGDRRRLPSSARSSPPPPPSRRRAAK